MVIEVAVALGVSLSAGGAMALFDRWVTRARNAKELDPTLGASPYRAPETPRTSADPTTGGFPSPPGFDD